MFQSYQWERFVFISVIGLDFFFSKCTLTCHKASKTFNLTEKAMNDKQYPTRALRVYISLGKDRSNKDLNDIKSLKEISRE